MADPASPSAEDRLLEAAVAVFARKGRDGARSREIAEAAGMDAPRVNYYFRSKDRLYEAAFARAFSDFTAGLAAAIPPGAPFREVLRAFVEHFVRHHAEHPEAVRLWAIENLAGGSTAVRLIQDADGPAAAVFGRFVDALAEAVDDGVVRPVDPYQTFVSVLGASLFLPIAYPTLAATLPPLAGDPAGFQADRADAVFELLWRGLRSGG